MKPFFKKIFLIDDNPFDLLISEHVIKHLMIADEIIIKRSGLQALAYFKENENFDVGLDERTLFVIDVNMPVMSGFEFVDEFKKLNLNLNCKIIILSSSESKEDANRAKCLAIDYFLLKPLNKDVLTGIINNLKN